MIRARVQAATSFSCLQQAASSAAAGDLDAETVAAVAVTRTQGHCCSQLEAAAMLHSPRHFLSFPSRQAGARFGGKGGGARSVSSSGARPLKHASSERSASGGERVLTCVSP